MGLHQEAKRWQYAVSGCKNTLVDDSGYTRQMRRQGSERPSSREHESKSSRRSSRHFSVRIEYDTWFSTWTDLDEAVGSHTHRRGAQPGLVAQRKHVVKGRLLVLFIVQSSRNRSSSLD